MTLEEIFVGVMALLIGLAFAFWGFRLFLILLPIWGFFVGFLFGADIVKAIFGEGFLATTTGWVVGVVVGILFAVLSYLYYWVAVVLLGATVGYAAGLGLLHWLGNGGDNLIGLIVGIIGAVIVAAIVVVLRLPKYLVIVLSALGGAFAALAGVALVFDRIQLDDVQYGIVGAFINDVGNLSWIWVVAALILAGVGMAYQIRTTEADEELVMESYRNPGMA